VLTFEQFVAEAAEKGHTVHLMFEEHLFDLVGTVERISKILADAKIPFELIGGGAVQVPVNRLEPSAVRSTKYLGMPINRADLDRDQDGHGATWLHVFVMWMV